MGAVRVPAGDAPPCIEWGVAGRAYPDERTSGDLHVICPREDGVLVAVVDGVGHGTEAAAAARIAAQTLQRHNAESVISLVRRCHAALFGTRGVAMSLARFNAGDDTMTWLAVGNVDGVLYRHDPAAEPARETIVMRGGVIGSRLPPLQAAIVTIAPGDLLVFATDGIDGRFSAQSHGAREPQPIADAILRDFSKGTDDALVLAARYVGAGGAGGAGAP